MGGESGVPPVQSNYHDIKEPLRVQVGSQPFSLGVVGCWGLAGVFSAKFSVLFVLSLAALSVQHVVA